MELDRPDPTAATVIRDRPDPDFELGPDPSRHRGGGIGLALAAGLALAVAGGAGLWWMVRQEPPAQEEAPAPTAPATPETPALVASVAPDAGLPSLDESDELVAKLALGLSNHPQLERWLGVGSFIRRVVVAVDNVAEGVSPRSHLAFLAPKESFSVTGPAAAPQMSSASVARYDLATEVLASFDMAGAARLYGRLRPLFIEAWRDLGHPDGNFDRRLLAAIDRLLATPTPAEAPLLIEKVASYEYADPQLEALLPAQKHLLRMGPANAAKVKDALRRLRTALTSS